MPTEIRFWIEVRKTQLWKAEVTREKTKRTQMQFSVRIRIRRGYVVSVLLWNSQCEYIFLHSVLINHISTTTDEMDRSNDKRSIISTEFWRISILSIWKYEDNNFRLSVSFSVQRARKCCFLFFFSFPIMGGNCKRTYLTLLWLRHTKHAVCCIQIVGEWGLFRLKNIFFTSICFFWYEILWNSSSKQYRTREFEMNENVIWYLIGSIL